MTSRPCESTSTTVEKGANQSLPFPGSLTWYRTTFFNLYELMIKLGDWTRTMHKNKYICMLKNNLSMSLICVCVCVHMFRSCSKHTWNSFFEITWYNLSKTQNPYLILRVYSANVSFYLYNPGQILTLRAPAVSSKKGG